MMDKSKTGSSRRKGDEYQDLTALRLALELYIQGAAFDLFIEYENSGNLDDIVVCRPHGVDAYQGGSPAVLRNPVVLGNQERDCLLPKITVSQVCLAFGKDNVPFVLKTK